MLANGADSGHIIQFKYPALLFLGDATLILAKTACGIAQWRARDCIGQFSLPGCSVDLQLPEIRPGNAAILGAKSMIIGVANDGGVISKHWEPAIIEALEAGLDIVSGLHERLDKRPRFVEHATRNGCRLIDLRHCDGPNIVGTGIKRTGRRLLTVGSDCAAGKMFTALAINEELQKRGIDSRFVATGQTGILISGSGVSVDAVVSDFLSGAVEALSPVADEHHWDIIEGQGALSHPSYAAVTLGLLHGSQPDVLVLCHDASRDTLDGYPDRSISDFERQIRMYEETAHVTNPNARCIGMSLNTSGLTEIAANNLIIKFEKNLGISCVDPIRTGVTRLVDSYDW